MKETELNYQNLAAMSLRISVVSISISCLTQPLQAVLNLKQHPELSIPKANFFHWAYRGFLSYAITGQKRGAIAISAKEAQHDAPRETQLGFTLGFSQLDILASNAFRTKSKLENAGIISATNFKWSWHNFYKLTLNNWGSRTIAGLINYSALGFFGDFCASSFHCSHALLNQILGGISAGAFASIWTAFPDFYADKKTLATQVHGFKLKTVSSYSMFTKLQQELKTHHPLEVLEIFFKQHYLKEIAIRIPLNTLTFAIIFSADYLLKPKDEKPHSVPKKTA